MHAIGDVDGDGFLAGEFAGGIAGGAQVFEGSRLGAGVTVLTGGRDVEIRRVGGEAAEDGERDVAEFCQRRVSHECDGYGLCGKMFRDLGGLWAHCHRIMM